MKVLIDCVPLAVGGGVQVAVGLLVQLQGETDMEWAAIVPNAMRPSLPSKLADDPRITYVNRRSQLDRFRLSRKLRKMERAFNPDLVFTVFGPPFFRPQAIHIVGFALPHVIYDRDDDMPRKTLVDHIVLTLRRRLFRHADRIVVETETARLRLAERANISIDRISVIPNGPNPLLRAVPESDAPTHSPFVIFIPSAYYWHKNLEIVPAVAEAMLRRAPDLEFVFRFTLPSESPAWSRILADAEKRGVGDRVTTMGSVKLSDLSSAYHQASATFLPTRREISTAVYPESFLFRRPLVTSDMDFARDLCGSAALYVSPCDADAIAAALIDLATLPRLRAKLVEEGTRQLARCYPTPEKKYSMQRDLMLAMVEDRVGSVAPTPAIEQNAKSTKRSQGVVRFHDEQAANWEAKYAGGRFQRRSTFFIEQVLPHLPQGGQWLDAGCGTGYFSRLLADRVSTVLGVDASGLMIHEARRRATQDAAVTFELIDTIERLHFPNESFHGAICLSVLEYLDSPTSCLAELYRVLRPGGTLVVSLPHRRAPIRLIQRLLYPGLRRILPEKWEYSVLSHYGLTTNEAVRTLRAAGFVTLHVLGFDSVIAQPLLRIFPPSLQFIIASRT